MRHEGTKTIPHYQIHKKQKLPKELYDIVFQRHCDGKKSLYIFSTICYWI